jgi:hypothetical protein
LKFHKDDSDIKEAAGLPTAPLTSLSLIYAKQITDVYGANEGVGGMNTAFILVQHCFHHQVFLISSNQGMIIQVRALQKKT